MVLTDKDCFDKSKTIYEADDVKIRSYSYRATKLHVDDTKVSIFIKFFVKFFEQSADKSKKDDFDDYRVVSVLIDSKVTNLSNKNLNQIFVKDLVVPLVDYIRYIDWKESLYNPISSRITFKWFDKDFADFILQLDRSPKDKWCIFVSAFSTNLPLVVNGMSASQFVQSKPILDELNNNEQLLSVKFDSCVNYLFPTFPMNRSRKSNAWFNIGDNKGFKELLKISGILNGDDESTVNTIPASDNRLMLSKDFVNNHQTEKIINSYAYLLDHCKISEKINEFVKEVEKSLTKKQYIDLLLSIENLVSNYGSHYNLYNILQFQYERIFQSADNLYDKNRGDQISEYNTSLNKKWLSDQFNNPDDITKNKTIRFYENKDDFNLTELLTKEEFSKMLQLNNLNSNIFYGTAYSFKLMKYYLNNVDSYEMFAKEYSTMCEKLLNDYMKSDVFDDKHFLSKVDVNYVESFIINKFSSDDNFSTVLEDFLKDTDVSLYMLLCIEGIDLHNEVLKPKN